MRVSVLLLVAVLVAGLSAATAYMIPSMLYSGDVLREEMGVADPSLAESGEARSQPPQFDTDDFKNMMEGRPPDWAGQNFDPNQWNGQQPRLSPGLEATFMVMNIISFILGILVFVSYCKLFSKAGEYWWAPIIPIYNVIVFLRIIGKEWYWIFLLIFLLMVPCLNIFIIVWLYVLFAQSFGRGILFGIGLTFLGFIFAPILAFGDSEYVGPAG